MERRAVDLATFDRRNDAVAGNDPCIGAELLQHDLVGAVGSAQLHAVEIGEAGELFRRVQRERLGTKRADHMEIAIAAQHASGDDAAIGQRRFGNVAEKSRNTEDEIVGEALGGEAGDDKGRVRAAAVQ
jgi:hypothetical protein